MKKIVLLALSVLMVLAVAGCTKPDEPDKPVAKTYKTGVGIITTAKANNATTDGDGKVEFDTNVVVATFDADGKVVSATVDVAQQGTKVTAKGEMTADADPRTKAEKGPDYGMKKFGKAIAEIDEQFAALANWMVGKTVAEITGMKLTEGKEAPDVEDLKSSVTISVKTFLDCLKMAEENAVETKGVAAKTGLGIETVVKANNPEGETAGKFEVDSNIVATALDADGKVVAAIIDVAQTAAKVNAKGEIVGEIDTRTKAQKGADYGMVKYGKAIAEIDAQMKSFAEWMNGKTPEEVMGIAVNEKGKPTVEELKSSVTVSVADYLLAFDKACKNAK